MRETHPVFPNQESRSCTVMPLSPNPPPSLFAFSLVPLVSAAFHTGWLPDPLHEPRPPDIHTCLQNTPTWRPHRPPASSCLKPKSSTPPLKYAHSSVSQHRRLHSYRPRSPCPHIWLSSAHAVLPDVPVPLSFFPIFPRTPFLGNLKWLGSFPTSLLQTCILTPKSVNTLHCHCLLAYLSSLRPRVPSGKRSVPFTFL